MVTEFVVRLPSSARAEARAGVHPDAAGVTVEAGPSRVLVVDDDEVGARLLSRLLQACGHRSSTVHDGEAALEAVAADPPDVVLLDIGLPGMDGHEVARRLRGMDGPAPILLVAVTGHGRDDDLRRSRESGFDHHILKPVDPDALIELIDRHRPAPPESSREPIAR